MKREIIFSSLILLLIIPFICADIINPGFHPTSINNYITNINDFPDYVFISGGGLGTGMCSLQIINSDGKISNHYYKFCGIFVYAIPKNKFNETKIEEMNSNMDLGWEEIKAYFNSIDGKEIITNIHTYKTVFITSSVKEENNYYTVSLSQVKTQPDSVETLRNGLFYAYIIVPIVALLIIIFILIKKRK